jgi:hypothetical protein
LGVGSSVVEGSCVSENFTEFEFVPGPPETVMATAAAFVARYAVSAAVIEALSCVALTNVVGRGEPFQFTTSPLEKPVPVTTRVKSVALQYGALLADVDTATTAVTVGSEIENETALEAPPPQFDAQGDGSGGLKTVTLAVPTEARSTAGTTAVSSTGAVCVASE